MVRTTIRTGAAMVQQAYLLLQVEAISTRIQVVAMEAVMVVVMAVDMEVATSSHIPVVVVQGDSSAVSRETFRAA